LRLGVHPQEIELALDRSLDLYLQSGQHEKNGIGSDYPGIVREACQRVLYNLSVKKLFTELPSLKVYNEVVKDAIRNAKFEIMMYNRFGNFEAFKKDAMDEEMEAYLGTLLALFEPLDTADTSQLKKSRWIGATLKS
jgi:hypothetical protein